MEPDKLTSLREVLADYRDDYSVCGKCKLCHACNVQEVYEGRYWRNCPSGSRFGYEGYYASGRLEMARALELGEIQVTPALLHSLYSCMLCGSCQEQCYPVKQMFPMRVFELLREKAVREGWGPLPEHQPVIDNMEAVDNPLGLPQAERGRGLEELDLTDASRENVEVLLFAGCSYSLGPESVKTARSAVRLLRSSGIEPGFLGPAELCCGAPLLELGDRDFFEAFAEENIRRINATGAEVVVTLCPHCAWVMKEEYGPSLRAQVNTGVELLAEELRRGGLEPPELEARAAWHDPCNLGRRLGVYEEPRVLLAAVPGIDIVELPRSRHNAFCCGGGGMASFAFPEYGQWVASERVSEADFVEADILVTACPHCESMLSGGVEARGSGVEVFNIFNLLARENGGDPR